MTSNYPLTGGNANNLVIFVYNGNTSLYEFYGEVKQNSIPSANEFNSRGNSYTLPSVRGSANNVLITNGAGTTSWQSNLSIGTLTTSGAITIPLGTVGSPSLNFAGDTNTGIYSSGADLVDIVTGGVSRITVSNTGTTINNLTTTGMTSSGNISLISPSGDSEIKIRTQNNLNSRLMLREFTDSYGCDFAYNGATNLISIDAYNVSKTTIFTTDVITNVSTFNWQVNFQSNMSFPNNTSTLSICGLSQALNSVINPQFTFLHPTTKLNQKTGLSYINETGSNPGLVLVSNGAAVAQAEATTGLTSYSQIRGTKTALTTPTFNFREDPDTGIGSDAADTVKIVCGGNTVAWLNNVQVRLISPAILLDSTDTYFGTSGNIKIKYDAVSGSGFDALNFYCQNKLRFQIVDNTSNIQECRFLGVTAQGGSYLSIIYWSDAHIYYRNSRNANDPKAKRHIFQGYDYQGLKSSFITPGESTWNTFTGQHICRYSFDVAKIGYIVCSSGVMNTFLDNNGTLEEKTGKDAITIDQSLPIVRYSIRPKEKCVFGVLCSIEDENATERDLGFDVKTPYTKLPQDRRAYVNSIGEGAIWVINTYPIENGDYVCSSFIKGLGVKQDDDLLHSYTVCKILMDCDFTNDTLYELRYIDINDNEMTKEEYTARKQNHENVYIRAFLPCTYHCG